MSKLEIPVHEFPVCIDFNLFMERLEKKHGWKHRDMSGKYRWQFETRVRLCTEYNIDYDVWGKISPVDMNETELAFLEIYQEEMKKTPPYQDVWHWMTDHPFQELSRGGINYLYIEDYLDDDDTPDYVKTVLQAILDEVVDHPSFSHGTVHFHIDW